MHPKHAVLEESTRANICYLACPDSNSTCSQDTSYHFRVKGGPPALSPAEQLFARSAPPALRPDPQFLYGFVQFRQKKNPSLARGYFQKVGPTPAGQSAERGAALAPAPARPALAPGPLDRARVLRERRECPGGG